MGLPDGVMTEIRAKRANMSEADISAIVAGVLTEIQVLKGWVTRYVILDAAGLAAFGENGHLGRHWTSDGRDMSLDALLVPDDADERWRFYEMSGRINGPQAVDWASTVVARISIPWEREVTLRSDATIEFGRMWMIDERSRRRLDRIRPDLIGRTFRAGSMSVSGSSPSP